MHHASPHRPPLREVVGERPVAGGHLLPDRDVARLPTPPHLDVGVIEEPVEVAQLAVAPAPFDADQSLEVERRQEQQRLTGDGVRADQGVGHGRVGPAEAHGDLGTVVVLHRAQQSRIGRVVGAEVAARVLHVDGESRERGGQARPQGVGPDRRYLDGTQDPE